jgi:hypothetical protein
VSYIPANVKRGEAFLDEHVPGWRDKVDPSELDSADSCHCVLGQVFGTYGDGLLLLRLTSREAQRLGFFVWGRQMFRQLTDGWRGVLS